MKPTIHARPHGNRIRGTDLSRSSPLFEGPFGRIFRALPPADFGPTDEASQAALNKLGAAMVADFDPPKDGPDDEESGIPAAFTYFGQFIDHDLTFDPASSLQRQNDPDALVDFRTPRFDLDSVYGRGPDDQPYLYADGRTFNLGEALTGAATNPRARDLPRSRVFDGEKFNAARAIIGDPRNDENTIVSQLQGLLLRFHNSIANAHPDWDFKRVQREVRFHYQWIVLNDFLPTIVSHDVLDDVLPHLKKKTNIVADPPRLRFYHPKYDLFMPLEFSAAAYRFGHSMVRPGYRVSETIPPLPIFDFDPTKPSLTGFQPVISTWAIDWNLFIDLSPRDPDDPTRLQLAYKIDTSLVNPLGKLPERVATNPPNLAQRNLLRGWRLRLPNGQDIARAMGLVPLADDHIRIGKFTGAAGDIKGDIVTVGGPEFAGNCPLWTYVLAETQEVNVKVHTTKGTRQIKTRRLGPVGGRIVAETFAGLLLGDSSSYLSQDPLWKPATTPFGLRELVAAALNG
ncbi:MAG: heme peroxidase [Acidobacteria bacterium]|nr:heme peroxidase [Acidobacteriota bacterium]MBV9476622.1 heme peroxidase [Acidobacteriota bacterium]